MVIIIPPELFRPIFAILSNSNCKRTLADFARSCRILYKLAAPYLYNELHLSRLRDYPQTFKGDSNDVLDIDRLRYVRTIIIGTGDILGGRIGARILPLCSQITDLRINLEWDDFELARTLGRLKLAQLLDVEISLIGNVSGFCFREVLACFTNLRKISIKVAGGCIALGPAVPRWVRSYVGSEEEDKEAKEAVEKFIQGMQSKMNLDTGKVVVISRNGKGEDTATTETVQAA